VKSRVGSAVLVIMSAVATCGALSTVAYCTGRGLDAARRFLDPSRAPTSDEAILACMADYALQSREANDVIFLGDSACRFGIDPIEFERLTGLRSYNLGTIGNAGPTVVLSTSGRSYLSSHPAPRLVVICLSPFSLGFDSNLGQFTLARRFADSYGDAEPLDRFAIFAKRGTAEIFGRHDTLELPLIGDESHTFRSAQAICASGRGHVALKGLTGPPGGGFDVGYIPIKPDWETELRSLLRTCEHSGSQVLLRTAPVHDPSQQGTDFTNVKIWIGNLRAARYAGLSVAEPAILFYEPGLFWNEMHLNRLGVEKFTALVAKDVQAALAK
jgi:hypothetical protein